LGQSTAAAAPRAEPCPCAAAAGIVASASSSRRRRARRNMSAIFDFSSLVTVLLLIICTCTYVRAMRPSVFDGGLSADDLASPHLSYKRRSGIRGACWKASRIGERLSPYVSVVVAAMAFHILLF
jgi:hypothetical protein